MEINKILNDLDGVDESKLFQMKRSVLQALQASFKEWIKVKEERCLNQSRQ